MQRNPSGDSLSKNEQDLNDISSPTDSAESKDGQKTETTVINSIHETADSNKAEKPDEKNKATSGWNFARNASTLWNSGYTKPVVGVMAGLAVAGVAVLAIRQYNKQ